MKYYFLAGQHEDAAGDYAKVYALCTKARGLLLELSSEASMSDEDKLLLARLDILLYKSVHEVTVERSRTIHHGVRAAIRLVCGGFDIAGSSCSLVLQLASMAYEHRGESPAYD